MSKSVDLASDARLPQDARPDAAQSARVGPSGWHCLRSPRCRRSAAGRCRLNGGGDHFLQRDLAVAVAIDLLEDVVVRQFVRSDYAVGILIDLLEFLLGKVPESGSAWRVASEARKSEGGERKRAHFGMVGRAAAYETHRMGESYICLFRSRPARDRRPWSQRTL